MSEVIKDIKNLRKKEGLDLKLIKWYHENSEREQGVENGGMGKW